MAKGTAFSRTVNYFREASHDEARAAYMLVNEIMQGRTHNGTGTQVAAKPKRKRRTKAEMAAAMALARAGKAAKAATATKAAVAASGGALAELYDAEAS